MRLPLPHCRDKRSLCHITAIPLFLERERERERERVNHSCVIPFLHISEVISFSR